MKTKKKQQDTKEYKAKTGIKTRGLWLKIAY
jgi:hypothetical protein